ncbi:MAG: hypothetical protein ACYCSN_14580 [Acidobacteriaceae bacterium]
MTEQKYGPQTPEIEALIAKIRSLTHEQAKALDDAWDDARNDAWYAVRYDASYAARDAAWYAARDAAWDAPWYTARDAILALLVRDLITPEQFDLLYGPWKSVMEKEKEEVENG